MTTLMQVTALIERLQRSFCGALSEHFHLETTNISPTGVRVRIYRSAPSMRIHLQNDIIFEMEGEHMRAMNLLPPLRNFSKILQINGSLMQAFAYIACFALEDPMRAMGRIKDRNERAIWENIFTTTPTTLAMLRAYKRQQEEVKLLLIRPLKKEDEEAMWATRTEATRISWPMLPSEVQRTIVQMAFDIDEP